MIIFYTVYEGTKYISDSVKKLEEMCDWELGNIYYADLTTPIDRFKIWSGKSTEIVLVPAILKNGDKVQIHQLRTNIWKEGICIAVETTPIIDFNIDLLISDKIYI